MNKRKPVQDYRELCEGQAVVLHDPAGTSTELRAENARLRELLNTPLHVDFTDAVQREAAHQRHRWGDAHDSGKQEQDWFWLLAYLSGKALRAHLDGDRQKALHHTISSAAVLLHWHHAISVQLPTTAE